MKIQEIRVIVNGNDEEFYGLSVTIIPDVYENRLSIKKYYPIDHIKSLFDMLWEDIGKELKNRLLSNEEKKNAEITRRLAAREIEDDDGFGAGKE